MKTNRDFIKLINKLKPFGAKVSADVINLDTYETFEYNPDLFIYPASVYKIFIAAEVLRQVETGQIKLSDKITIKSPNDIDNESRFYPTDTFPVWHAGDVVEVESLLITMLQRSDNTASNTLIDLVHRKSISENIIATNGWTGSDVTRKFLNRLHEDKPYKYADITVSSGRHLAEFMQRLDADKLVSKFVSRNMKKYMSNGSDRAKLSNLLIHRQPQNWLGKVVFEKGGWIEAFSSKLPRIIRRFYHIRYQSQAAIVQTKSGRYAIGILTSYKTIFPQQYFRFSKITEWLE